MVADESAVLPDARAVDSDDDESSFAFEDIVGDYRPRANRPSQDEGWVDTDHYNEDTPSESHSAAEWRQAHRDLEPIMVNGAIVEQWRHAQGAIAQVIARMRVVIGNDDGSVCREDLSCHFYGAASPLFTCLQRRLKWDHRLFCKFVLTGMRLSANNWNAAQLYDKEHPQLNVDECMPEAQYHQCWRAISACGLPNTREDSANGEVPLWEEMQTALNTLLRTFVVECRTGRFSVVLDDHKQHIEFDPRKVKNLGIRIIKHVADNRWGFTIDTVVDAVTLLIANVQAALVGVPQHEAMRQQLFGSTFGRHPFRVPDLSNVEMHCDRGYFSETTFLTILLAAGCWLTCTCPRGKWLPFHTVYEGDDRIIERQIP